MLSVVAIRMRSATERSRSLLASWRSLRHSPLVPVANLSADDRAEVIAFAREKGCKAAAKFFKLPLGSVKSWLSRDKGNRQGLQKVADQFDATATALHAAPIEVADVQPSEEAQVMEPPTEEASEVARPSRRKVAEVAADSDGYIAGLQRELHAMIAVVAQARRGKGSALDKVKVLTAGLEKLERAGRVPFGYGVPDGQQGSRALINVSIHNQAGRGGDLPPVIEMQELPPVSSEIDEQARASSQVVEAEIPPSQ